MLNHVVKIFLCFFLFSCTTKDLKSTRNSFITTSMNVVGAKEYSITYKMICDSIVSWANAGIGYFKYCGNGKNCFIDSLLAFNSTKDRLIAAKLMQQHENDVADGIEFMYGEKINGQWYFFSGPFVTIPREMIPSHPRNKVLSYQQLHQIALKEIYGGYLKPDGSINEDWFKYHFDKQIWNFREYKTKEEYNKIVIGMCQSKWAERFKPYSRKDFTFEYDDKSKNALLTFEVKTFDSTYNAPYSVKVLYEYPGLGYVGSACRTDWCPKFDWKKNKLQNITINNLPPNTEIKIYIEICYEPNAKSERMGPFIFSTNKNHV